jgi:hypothetical protein
MSLFRNPSFIMGLISMVAFMSAGFIVCLVASSGQLMFSPILFILAPVPFALSFDFFAIKFQEKRRMKSKWSRFVAYTLIANMILIILLFALAMKWLEYWGVLRWL